MVEVFKTNVNAVNEAHSIIALLCRHFPGSRINFDLEDCDKVLRIEGENFATDKVMTLVKENGFTCQELE